MKDFLVYLKFTWPLLALLSIFVILQVIGLSLNKRILVVTESPCPQSLDIQKAINSGGLTILK